MNDAHQVKGVTDREGRGMNLRVSWILTTEAPHNYAFAFVGTLPSDAVSDTARCVASAIAAECGPPKSPATKRLAAAVHPAPNCPVRGRAQ
jgi:hypothetical protein